MNPGGSLRFAGTRQFWLGLGLMTAGFVPLLYWHVAGLLERPHYQFLFVFPFALALLIGALPAVDDSRRSNGWCWVAASGLSLSLLMLGFASWAWSPWIAAASALLAVICVLLFTGGPELLKEWAPLCVFLAVLIPLPFGMDEELIVRLRSVTCQATSSLLDQLGVLHGAFANIIQLPGKPLFVGDACSGIHSLYVLFAIGLFIIAYFRRSVLHSIILLATTFGLVLVENITRIGLVAVAWGYGFDWSEGLPHTVLGTVLFCMSFALVLSADQLWLFLLPDIPALIRKFRIAPLNSSRSSMTKSAALRIGTSLEYAWLATAAAFALVGLFQLTRLPAVMPNALAAFESTFELPSFREDLLSPLLEGFTQTRYESLKRVDGDPFGRNSQKWTFVKGRVNVQISIDYPYLDRKDLSECYELVGWNLGPQKVYSSAELVNLLQSPGPIPEIAAVVLRKEFFGESWLLFSHTDLKGNLTARIKSLARGDTPDRVNRRFLAFGTQTEAEAGESHSEPPYINFHLVANGVDRLTDSQRNEILKMFVAMRKVLLSEILRSVAVQETIE
jgi:exosortase